MRDHLPNRASALLVVVAAFIAFGGVSVAAARYVITSKKQIAPSVLRQLIGPRGLHGKTGVAGTAGVAGAPGMPGTFNASNVTVVDGPTVMFTTTAAESTASCPAGDTVISGGFQSVNGPITGGSVSADGPSGTSGWAVQIVSVQAFGFAATSGGDGNAYTTGSGGWFYAQAVCAS
jgi:hypothetical protein